MADKWDKVGQGKGDHSGFGVELWLGDVDYFDDGETIV